MAARPQLPTGARRLSTGTQEEGRDERLEHLLPKLTAPFPRPEGSLESYKEQSSSYKLKCRKRIVLAPRAWEAKTANMIT